VGRLWPSQQPTEQGRPPPAISWFLRKYPLGWVVVTSGSWNQLRNQLWPSLSILRDRNPGWSVRRGSECIVTTTEARERHVGGAVGFSTNDANRAEGWHPKINRETDPVFIIVDEAKSVPDEIFGAFQRCTRVFQLWVSSPGKPSGKFYEAFHRNAGLYWTRKVRSDECPHIDPKKREFDREELGADSPLYRSMHDAEFTSLDERVVISPESLTHAFLIQAERDATGEKVAFSDFAAGGDEDTVSYRHGNVVTLKAAWRSTDTVQSRRRHIEECKGLGISGGQVWGDADGMGNVIIRTWRRKASGSKSSTAGRPRSIPRIIRT
jgi:phage terminase large subunit